MFLLLLRSRARLVLLLLAVLLGHDARSYAQTTAGEHEVKAAFLYNFAKFVEWPATSFPRADSPISLCVWGANPFARALDVVDGKPVGARQLAVAASVGPDRAASCSIVFVGAPDIASARAAVQSLRDKPVLTVGEVPGFAQAGGIIGFVIVDGRVRFEINPKAAARVGIGLSSQLLRLATIVEEGGS